MAEPFHKNPCGSDACDYLQVKVTSECNGRCAWCIEKRFGRVTPQAPIEVVQNAIAASDKPNVVFSGGEPTLSERLLPLIKTTVGLRKHAWVWTNGYAFGEDADLLRSGVSGVTLSIHHFDLEEHRCITGIDLCMDRLIRGVRRAKSFGVKIHLTCCCVAEGIDTQDKIYEYVDFAKALGVDRIRFAELSMETERFVDLHAIAGEFFGLSDDPFTFGCETQTTSGSMIILATQACGLNTPVRRLPATPFKLHLNPVLYEDGVTRVGW